MRILLTVLTSFFLVSCASVPKLAEMKSAIQNYKLPNEAQKGEATIYVLRPDSIGGLVRFNIHVGHDDNDENEIGWTRGNQKLLFYLPAGKHRILSVAENTYEIDLEVKAGEKIFLRQNPHIGFIFARNSLHKSEKIEGTYWFMKLEDGEYKRKRISGVSEIAGLSN